ncbi:phosphatase PAP2 family protein [Streptomyces sp. ODS28]|uniref:phosphatase PAP2 family protein n=1 Tax=Streptomyces sp. ODS28 TaxID=3136688 RepID=UPI0031EC1FF2
MVLALLTWQVAAHGPLRATDEHAGAALRGHAPATAFAELLADLGNMAVALPLLAAALAYAGRRTRRWLLPAAYALAMAAVPVLVSLLKLWIDRPGPLGGTGYYPSGHAATAAVAFGGAALALAHGVLDRVRARIAWAASTVLTALNGIGLVWRGYHWPLDVLASWCLGWLLLVAATAVVRRAHRRTTTRRQS